MPYPHEKLHGGCRDTIMHFSKIIRRTPLQSSPYTGREQDHAHFSPSLSSAREPGGGVWYLDSGLLMFRLLLKSIALMIVLFIIAIGAVMGMAHLQGQQRLDEIRAFLLEGECALPCFMGITPGVTTYNEAINILVDNGWVETVIQPTGEEEFGQIYLELVWSDLAPPMINHKIHSWIRMDAEFNDEDLDMYNSSVASFSIKANIRLHDLSIVLGQPLFTRALVDRNNMVAYNLGYTESLHELTVNMLFGITTPCPISLIIGLSLTHLPHP